MTHFWPPPLRGGGPKMWSAPPTACRRYRGVGVPRPSARNGVPAIRSSTPYDGLSGIRSACERATSPIGHQNVAAAAVRAISTFLYIDRRFAAADFMHAISTLQRIDAGYLRFRTYKGAFRPARNKRDTYVSAHIRATSGAADRQRDIYVPKHRRGIYRRRHIDG